MYESPPEDLEHSGFLKYLGWAGLQVWTGLPGVLGKIPQTSKPSATFMSRGDWQQESSGVFDWIFKWLQVDN